MPDERKREGREAGAFGFLVGWFAGLLLGLYLGTSGNEPWVGLAIIGGIAFGALWHSWHTY